MKCDKLRGALLKACYIAAVLLGCIMLFCSSCFSVSAADTISLQSDSSLSEQVMEQALQIIENEKGKKFDADTIAQLIDLGLSESQIEMLKSLSAANQELAESQSEVSWENKILHWYEHPAALFVLLGIAISGVILAITIIIRKFMRIIEKK